MKILILFILSISISLISSSDVIKFNNYKVYRTNIQNNADINRVFALEENYNNTFSIWSTNFDKNKYVDVMVAPGSDDLLLQLFPGSEVFIEDVQELIDNERPGMGNVDNMKGSLINGMKGKREMGWEDYYKYEEINDWLKELVEEFPENVRLINVGKSYQGRDIIGVCVSYSKENKDKGIVLESGMHAREWIGPSTVTYILNELLRSTDPKVRKIAESHDWYIYPIFNPDGYSYTFERNRMWRKTRKPNGLCIGTDPNRNWGYKWRSSWNPCTDTYPGPRAFSEPETKALSEHFKTIGSNLIGYISFHAYSQLLLLPYGDSAAHRDNYDELYSVGKRMVEEIEKVNGTQYKLGNIVELLYPAYGNNVDWIKSSFKTRMTFIFELRDKGKYGFLLPANQIIPCAKETMVGLLTMFQEFDNIDNPQN